MSVIAVRKHESGYTMSADSITIHGWNTKDNGMLTKHVKLVNVNGMVLGSSGSVEETSLFSIFLETHQPEEADKLSVVRVLSDFSKWKESLTGDRKVEDHYLLGFKGAVYRIMGFCVMEVNEFDAIGYGYREALTALALGHSTEKAIQVACELSAYCSLPVHTVRKNR